MTRSGDRAAVIDPSWPADLYLDLARRRGSTIRQVLETHIHAGHVSRARALASQTGAALLLPTQQRAIRTTPRRVRPRTPTRAALTRRCGC
jgi:glyoxylase-like metal-dependent hydrolase (beta-lactamase superfamily II)